MVAPPAALHLVDAVDAAGVEQDPLAERGFARVDMGGNSDIPQHFQVHENLDYPKKRSSASTPFQRASCARVGALNSLGHPERPKRACQKAAGMQT